MGGWSKDAWFVVTGKQNRNCNIEEGPRAMHSTHSQAPTTHTDTPTTCFSSSPGLLNSVMLHLTEALDHLDTFMVKWPKLLYVIVFCLCRLMHSYLSPQVWIQWRPSLAQSTVGSNYRIMAVGTPTDFSPRFQRSLELPLEWPLCGFLVHS